MARKWSSKEEQDKRKELSRLYIQKNLTIGEIGKMLSLGESTIYDRLIRLRIKPIRHKKPGFNNVKHNIKIPKHYTAELAEFMGIILGDGHLSPTQVTVTLGNKEPSYVRYVAELMSRIFKAKVKIIKTHKGYYVLYFGSTKVVHWLISDGLAYNKVKSQVSIPSWLYKKKDYMQNFLRGFFDTDGSIYKLRHGIQLAFTNRSKSLLRGVKTFLENLNYKPSNISLFRVYLTKKRDIFHFFEIINPANQKHQARFKALINTKKRWGD